MSKTKNQKERKRKVDGPQPRYKHNSNSVHFGSTKDFVARMDWRFYKFLGDIFSYASWDGENWVKPNLTNLSNPLESEFKNTIESNLEIRDELINQKLIFQSEDYYWSRALEYQKHLENGGEDLAQPNGNIHKTFWIENPNAKPINVLINNETGEAFQVPVEGK